MAAKMPPTVSPKERSCLVAISFGIALSQRAVSCEQLSSRVLLTAYCFLFNDFFSPYVRARQSSSVCPAHCPPLTAYGFLLTGYVSVQLEFLLPVGIAF